MPAADTWVEVRRDALRTNLERVAKHAGVPVCAVVKANAYGHGIVECARTFATAGASMLGVTRLDEARSLRAAGIDAPVLIFVPPSSWEDAFTLGCEVTVASASDVASLPSGARAHLKVDTGMGRLGVTPGEAIDVARAIAARATLASVWTHLADAGGATGTPQVQRFKAVVSALRHGGIEAPAHAANSAGLLALPDARFDMVRAGTLLYGQDPAGASAPWQHEETFTWYARVASVRTIPRGGTLGYGSEWRAREPTRIATIPVGYADGFGVQVRARTPSARELARTVKGAMSPERVVYFGDRAAPVLGRIGMQMISVSLEGIDRVGPGDVARIPARRLTVSPSIERVYT